MLNSPDVNCCDEKTCRLLKGENDSVAGREENEMEENGQTNCEDRTMQQENRALLLAEGWDQVMRSIRDTWPKS